MTFSKRIKVINKNGLHARPASGLVNIANGFESELHLSRIDGDSRKADCKSVLQILLLGASKDTELELSAKGIDAADAINEISDYFNRNFDEFV